MKIIKSWSVFEQNGHDDEEEPKPKAKKADINPHDVVKMGSLINKSAKANDVMSIANNFFNKGKYFDAFKQYKTAQQQDPDHFWAYYNAATSAYNAGTSKSIKMIPEEITKAKAILQNWQGDETEKAVAIKQYKALLKNIRKNTNLNL